MDPEEQLHKECVEHQKTKDQLTEIEKALDRYHEALTARKHGGVAAGAFVNECEVILQNFWNQ